MSGLPADGEVGAILERLADQLGLRISQQKNGQARLVRPDGTAVQTWRQDFPYDQRLSRDAYHAALQPLQIELLKLQRSVKASAAGSRSSSRDGTRRARAARSAGSWRT